MEHYAYLYSQAQQQNAVRMDEYYHELRQQELREPPGFWKTFWVRPRHSQSQSLSSSSLSPLRSAKAHVSGADG